jgi:hypothetical protein
MNIKRKDFIGRAYVNSGQLVIVGEPGIQKGHDCGAMGCSGENHIIYRASTPDLSTMSEQERASTGQRYTLEDLEEIAVSADLPESEEFDDDNNLIDTYDAMEGWKVKVSFDGNGWLYGVDRFISPEGKEIIADKFVHNGMPLGKQGIRIGKVTPW